eukprot:403362564
MNNSSIEDGILQLNQVGLAFDLFQTSSIINNTNFTNLNGRMASAIYSYDKAQSTLSVSLKIVNSRFTNNHVDLDGGAILLRDIDGYLEGNQFLDNQAIQQKGGALYLSCSQQRIKKCDFSVFQNNFTNNQALSKGGAIYYDLYSPAGLMNNFFKDNQAQYGQNYASYPYKLKLIKDQQRRELTTTTTDSLMGQFVSGQMLNSKIKLGIYDQNDQLISNDDESETLLTSSDLTMQVSQNNKITAQNGIYEFSELVFVAKPSYTTKLKFVTNAIDSVNYNLVAGQAYQDYEVNISFRECIEGEITQNNMCVECQKGTYSFNPLSFSCDKCFEYGVCQGNNITGVIQGFWRSSNHSVKAYQCPNQESCLGGMDSQCKIGYEGKLCTVCSRDVNGTQYARQGANSCIECEKLSIQVLKLLGILLLIAVYVVYLLYSIINSPKRNKPQTVLIRILTNYFHAIMIVKDFDMSWPSQVEDALNSFSFVSSQSQSIFSLDCFYTNTKNLGMPLFYIKLLIAGLLPIILSTFAGLVWFLIYLKKKSSGKEINLKQNIMVTSFIFIYLCYPIITNQNFSAFSCQTLDEGKSYLKTDYSIQCWTGDHSRLSTSIGLSYIFFWTIGFPVFVYLILRKNHRNLDDKKIILQYGLFFVGLNDDSYYWEIVVVNGLIGIIVLLAQVQLLFYKMPYLDPRFNHIEKQSIYAASLTLYGGIFFVQEEVRKNNGSLFVLFLVILFYNIYFLAYWLLMFVSILFRIHAQKLIKLRFLRFIQIFNLKDYESDLNHQREQHELKMSLVRGLTKTSRNFDKNTNQTSGNNQPASDTKFSNLKSFRESERGLLASQGTFINNSQNQSFHSPRNPFIKKISTLTKAISKFTTPVTKIHNGKLQVNTQDADFMTEIQSPTVKRNKNERNNLTASKLLPTADKTTEISPKKSRFAKEHDYFTDKGQSPTTMKHQEYRFRQNSNDPKEVVSVFNLTRMNTNGYNHNDDNSVTRTRIRGSPDEDDDDIRIVTFQGKSPNNQSPPINFENQGRNSSQAFDNYDYQSNSEQKEWSSEKKKSVFYEISKVQMLKNDLNNKQPESKPSTHQYSKNKINNSKAKVLLKQHKNLMIEQLQQQIQQLQNISDESKEEESDDNNFQIPNNINNGDYKHHSHAKERYQQSNQGGQSEAPKSTTPKRLQFNQKPSDLNFISRNINMGDATIDQLGADASIGDLLMQGKIHSQNKNAVENLNSNYINKKTPHKSIDQKDNKQNPYKNQNIQDSKEQIQKSRNDQNGKQNNEKGILKKYSGKHNSTKKFDELESFNQD